MSENLSKMLIEAKPTVPSRFQSLVSILHTSFPTVNYSKMYPGEYLPARTRYSQVITYACFISAVILIKKFTYGFTDQSLPLDSRKYYTMPFQRCNIFTRYYWLSGLETGKRKFVF